MAKKYKFVDGEYEVGSTVKCSCCGRDVKGYPPLIIDRVCKQFGGEWQRYISEWKCSDCKKKANDSVVRQVRLQMLQDKLDKAIKLLEDNGYIVEKIEENIEE